MEHQTSWIPNHTLWGIKVENDKGWGRTKLS